MPFSGGADATFGAETQAKVTVRKIRTCPRWKSQQK
jgi:hypothetical protein